MSKNGQKLLAFYL